MDIGINMEGIEYQLTDTSCIVFMYGHDMEVGFLKINPERVPVVTSESIVNSEIRQEEKTYEVFSLCRNKYALVVESGAYEMENCNLVLYGNAYIARQQKNTVSALTSDEVFEWLKKLNRPITFHNAEIDKQSVIIFEHDENTNTWY